MANLRVMKDASEIVRYDNPEVPLYVVKGLLSDMSGMRAFCHWHDDIEFIHVVRGNMTYDINGTEVFIAEGCGIMVSPHQMHFGYSSDGTDCEYVCVLFRPDLLCRNRTLSEKYILPIESSGHFPYVLFSPSETGSTEILNSLDEMYRIKKSGIPCYEFDCIAILHHIWSELYRRLQNDISDTLPDERDTAALKKMLSFLYRNFSKKITLKDTAAAGGVCRSTCCAMFRKYLGRPPMDYLNAYRIETAVNMLNTTKENITEIAYSCGYTSSSYFAEQFRQLKGCSPSEYRNDGKSSVTEPASSLHQ